MPEAQELYFEIQMTYLKLPVPDINSLAGRALSAHIAETEGNKQPQGGGLPSPRRHGAAPKGASGRGTGSTGRGMCDAGTEKGLEFGGFLISRVFFKYKSRT